MEQAIFWFHRIHQADDVLLRLCYLTLRGLLLGVLLRKVPADHAAIDRNSDSVVPRVMPSDPIYHRALEAACNQGDSYQATIPSQRQ